MRHSPNPLASPLASPLAGLLARLLAGLLATLPLAACTVARPAGPTVIATPGDGKSFEQFQFDDGRCRDYAISADGGVTPRQAATSSGVGSAVTGTAVGAAAGALLGAATGSAGAGAAFGAGGGLLLGSLVGSRNAELSAGALQASYDRAYAQCMIASGEAVGGLPQAVAVGYPPPVVVQQAPVVVVAPSYGYGWHGGWGNGGW